jgi:surface protein
MSLKKGTKDVSLLTKIPPKLGTKTITSNGTYKASEENLDGYSEVNVETSGVDINDYFYLDGRDIEGKVIYYNYLGTTIIKTIPEVDTSTITNFMFAFSNFNSLETIPLLDTSKGINFSHMFNYCRSLKTIPQLDVSSAQNLTNMFTNCSVLETIPKLNTANATNMYSMFLGCSKLMGENGTGEITLDIGNSTNIVQTFSGCQRLQKITLLNSNTAKFNTLNSTFNDCTFLVDLSAFYCEKVNDVRESCFNGCINLTNFDGLINLGKAYTSHTINYSNYTLNLSQSSKLTHSSLVNIINGVYDIASIGVASQRLILGSTNIAKLTSEEIAIATNKGWTVS